MRFLERRLSPDAALVEARRMQDNDDHYRMQRRWEREALEESFRRHPCPCQETGPLSGRESCDLCGLSLDERLQFEMEGPPEYHWYWLESSVDDERQAADPGQADLSTKGLVQ